MTVGKFHIYSSGNRSGCTVTVTKSIDGEIVDRTKHPVFIDAETKTVTIMGMPDDKIVTCYQPKNDYRLESGWRTYCVRVLKGREK